MADPRQHKRQIHIRVGEQVYVGSTFIGSIQGVGSKYNAHPLSEQSMLGFRTPAAALLWLLGYQVVEDHHQLLEPGSVPEAVEPIDRPKERRVKTKGEKGEG